MYQKILYFIVTFMESGKAPKAPGTMGSLATLPLSLILAYFFGRSGILYGTAIVFVLGVLTVAAFTKNMAEKDPGFVVIDETAGQLMTFVLVAPKLEGQISFGALAVYLFGFILFRLFDILKFGPVKWADTKLKNAFGVMLDDVFAGIFAAIVLMLVASYIGY